MKKIYAIFGLALAMLTAGCAKDATNDLVKETVTFKAGIENSRTSLGELNGTQYPVLWSAGDVVAVSSNRGKTSSAARMNFTRMNFFINLFFFRLEIWFELFSKLSPIQTDFM